MECSCKNMKIYIYTLLLSFSLSTHDFNFWIALFETIFSCFHRRGVEFYMMHHSNIYFTALKLCIFCTFIISSKCMFIVFEFISFHLTFNLFKSKLDHPEMNILLQVLWMWNKMFCIYKSYYCTHFSVSSIRIRSNRSIDIIYDEIHTIFSIFVFFLSKENNK